MRAVSLTRLAVGRGRRRLRQGLRRGPDGHVPPRRRRVVSITMHAGLPARRARRRASARRRPGQVSKAHGTQHTDMSYSYVQRGGVEQFHPFDYLGFRYLQIDDPGETLTPADVVALHAPHRGPRRARGHVLVVGSPPIDAIFELGAPLGAVHRAGAVHRHADAREGLVALGRLQRVEDRDGRVRRAEPHPQVAARVRAVAGAATGRTARSTRSIRPVSARSTSTSSPRSTPNGCGSTGCTPATARCSAGLPGAAQSRRLRRQRRSTRRPGSSRACRRRTSTTTSRSSRASTCWASNVFRRVGDDRRARSAGRTATITTPDATAQHALADAINARLTRARRHLRRRARRERHARSPRRRRTPTRARSCYGVVPAARSRRGRRRTSRASGMSAPPRTASRGARRARAHRPRHRPDRASSTTRPHDGWANILARGGTFTWEVWQPSDVIGDSMSHGWGSNVLVEHPTVAARRHTHRPRLRDLRRLTTGDRPRVRGRHGADPRGHDRRLVAPRRRDRSRVDAGPHGPRQHERNDLDPGARQRGGPTRRRLPSLREQLGRSPTIVLELMTFTAEIRRQTSREQHFRSSPGRCGRARGRCRRGTGAATARRTRRRARRGR